MAEFRFMITGMFGAVGPSLYYAFTSASAQRKGLYLSAVSGSPPISLEPRSGSPDYLLEGDIWYEQSGSAGDGNLFVAEKDAEGTASAHRFVTAREGETVQQIINRFGTSDAPTDLRVGANAVVVNGHFVTINSESLSGSLIWNASWSGGLAMLDANTIVISGSDKNFLVPSGSASIERGDFVVQSGSIEVYSGNMVIKGDSASFDISGSSISASLQGNPIMSILTGSINSGSLSPVPIDGTLYVNTSSLEKSLRASGTYFDLDFTAPSVVDGGSY